MPKKTLKWRPKTTAAVEKPQAAHSLFPDLLNLDKQLSFFPASVASVWAEEVNASIPGPEAIQTDTGPGNDVGPEFP